MKTLATITRILSLAVLTTISGTVYSVPITGLFNTGVNYAGTVLPVQSVEQHYTVSGGSSVSFVVPVVFHYTSQFANGGRAWVDAPAGSAWIGPNPNMDSWPQCSEETYHYKLDFFLTESEAAQAQIAGLFTGDNGSSIYLNGEYTGFTTSPSAFYTLHAFLLTSGFVPGVNTLEFVVPNGNAGLPNPTGLLVAGLTGAIGESLSLPVVPTPTYTAVDVGSAMSNGGGTSNPGDLPPELPDAGSTLLLFGCAVSLFGSIRRFFRF